MTSFIGQLFNNLTGQVNAQASGIFGITFHISWQSIIISYCLGVILTFVVITVSSCAREPHEHRQRHPRCAGPRPGPAAYAAGRHLELALPCVADCGGAALLVRYMPGGWLSVALLALTLLLFGVMLLLGRIFTARGANAVRVRAAGLQRDRPGAAAAVGAALAALAGPGRARPLRLHAAAIAGASSSSAAR